MAIVSGAFKVAEGFKVMGADEVGDCLLNCLKIKRVWNMPREVPIKGELGLSTADIVAIFFPFAVKGRVKRKGHLLCGKDDDLFR